MKNKFQQEWKVFKHVCLIKFKHIIFLLLFFSPFPALNIGHCNPIPTGQPTTRNPNLKERVEFASLVLRGLLLFLMGMGSASMHLLRGLFAKVPKFLKPCGYYHGKLTPTPTTPRIQKGSIPNLFI